MNAADLLRTALDDAPTMRADKDAFNELAVWDANNDWVLGNYGKEGQAAIRLVGLLLAAAPHLADLLDADEAAADGADDGHEAANRLAELRDAITEAGESL